MDGVMLAAFENELRKMAEEGNFAAPSVSQGSNIMTQPVFPKSGIKPMTDIAKPKATNYSIVHNQAPTAADSAAPAPVKAVPPPPVRT